MTGRPKQPLDEWDFVPNENDEDVLPRPGAAEDEAMHLRSLGAVTRDGSGPERRRSVTQDVGAARAWCVAAVVLAAVSACLEAAVDATTIMARVSGSAVTGRSLWIGSFVVSIITVVVAGLGWSRRDPAPNAMHWAYGIAALLNLAVPVVFAVRPGEGIVLPLLHLVTAMVLAALARPVQAYPHPTNPVTS